MSDNKELLKYEELAKTNGGACLVTKHAKGNLSDGVEAWVTDLSHTGWRKEAEKIIKDIENTNRREMVIGAGALATAIKLALPEKTRIAHIKVTIGIGTVPIVHVISKF